MAEEMTEQEQSELRTLLDFEASKFAKSCNEQTIHFNEDGISFDPVPDVRQMPRKGGSGFNPLWLALSGVHKKKTRYGMEDDPQADPNAVDLEHLPMDQALVEYQKRLTEKRLAEEAAAALAKEKQQAKIKEIEKEIKKKQKIKDEQNLKELLALDDRTILANILLELRKLNNIK